MAWEKLQKSIDDEGHDFYSKYWPKTVQASTWVKAVFYTESRTKGKYIIISSASSFPYPLYYVSSTQLFEPAPEALIPGPLSVLAKKESSLSKEEEHEQEEKLREYVVSTGELSHIVSNVVEILGKWYEQSSDKRAQLRKSLPKGKPKS
jgi:hypothetical protein